MQSIPTQSSKIQITPLVLALVGGLIISAVDNFAAGGEVSPIVIVPMLLLGSAIIGAIWGSRALSALVLFWLPLPGAHVVKHLLGLRDTLHPNTYGSIAMLAGFSLVVCAVGFGVAAGVHRLLRPAS